ncbi:MAG: lytic transglycosylase domain-containing protein [Desulfobacterales bacterium]
MSTGDHLTIRDYWDLVFKGNQKTRAIFPSSQKGKAATEDGNFFRILASRPTQRAVRSNAETTGLTIVDYLANPVSLKSRYPRSLTPLPALAKKKEDSGHPDQTPLKDLAEKPAATSLAKLKAVPSSHRSAAARSPQQFGVGNRQKIEDSIQQAAIKYKLPPALIKGVIRAESNFRINAVSPAGAQGLMQLMPATAKELGVTKPFDVGQNIDGGSRYLRKMLDSFDGNVRQALAAYNAGPGTVRKYNGVVPYPETIQYIDRVLRFSEQAA